MRKQTDKCTYNYGKKSYEIHIKEFNDRND